MLMLLPEIAHPRISPSPDRVSAAIPAGGSRMLAPGRLDQQARQPGRYWVRPSTVSGMRKRAPTPTPFSANQLPGISRA